MSKYFADSSNELSQDNSSFENENLSQPSTSQILTQDQVDRIDKNRKRALEIRKNKEENSAKM
jgi:hypothetical protein